MKPFVVAVHTFEALASAVGFGAVIAQAIVLYLILEFAIGMKPKLQDRFLVGALVVLSLGLLIGGIVQVLVELRVERFTVHATGLDKGFVRGPFYVVLSAGAILNIQYIEEYLSNVSTATVGGHVGILASTVLYIACAQAALGALYVLLEITCVCSSARLQREVEEEEQDRLMERLRYNT